MNHLLTAILLLCPFLVLGQASDQRPQRKKNIVVKEYFENGPLKAKGRKKLQEKVIFTPDRSMHEVMTYSKQGRWTEYYRNGQKKRIVVYDKGKIVKHVKSWNEDGSLALLSQFTPQPIWPPQHPTP